MRKGFIRGNSFPLIPRDVFSPRCFCVFSSVFLLLSFIFCFSVYVVDCLLCFNLFGGHRGVFSPYSRGYKGESFSPPYRSLDEDELVIYNC